MGEWQGALRHCMVLVRSRRRYVHSSPLQDLSLKNLLPAQHSTDSVSRCSRRSVQRRELTRSRQASTLLSSSLPLDTAPLPAAPRPSSVTRLCSTSVSATSFFPAPVSFRDTGFVRTPPRPVLHANPGSQVAFLFIDRWGRKPLQLLGFCVLTITVRCFLSSLLLETSSPELTVFI